MSRIANALQRLPMKGHWWRGTEDRMSVPWKRMISVWGGIKRDSTVCSGVGTSHRAYQSLPDFISVVETNRLAIGQVLRLHPVVCLNNDAAVVGVGRSAAARQRQCQPSGAEPHLALRPAQPRWTLLSRMLSAI